MNYKIAALCAAIATLSGCASIIDGKSQNVSVKARNQGVELTGAKCSLVNDKGEWKTLTPESTTVQRSYRDLSVNCAYDGLEPGSFAAKSKTKALTFGNIIFGGVIGAGIDIGTGAAYDYPDLICVEMGTAGSSAPVKPDAGVVAAPAPACVRTPAEKAVAEKAVAEKATAGKAAAEKVAVEKVSLEKVVAGKVVVETAPEKHPK